MSEEKMEELRAERDALAAQVRAAQCIAARWQGNDDNIGQTLTALELWADRVDIAPDESLARRDAEKQAEALEATLRELGYHMRADSIHEFRNGLLTEAARLRRRAGEGE